MLNDPNGFVFTNNLSNSITLNDFVYPFSKQLDIQLDDPRIDKTRVRAVADGTWFIRNQLSGITITVEGDIFGTDSADYFAKRTALADTLRNQDPTARSAPPVRDYGDGFILIDWVGSTEVWTTDAVYVQAFSAPITVNNQEDGPSRTPYMITFWSPIPYFYGNSTNDIYWYS